MTSKRITDVDYIESLNSNESFFVNQNNAIKQINRGNIIFNIANGGTGATNVKDARENLGLGSVAVENIIPISKGGTGATDAAEARELLEITPENIGASVHNHNHSNHAISPASVDLRPSSSANHGGYIDFNYNNTADDYTSRIIEELSGMLTFATTNGIKLTKGTFGDTLPDAGVAGRIFFKKISS